MRRALGPLALAAALAGCGVSGETHSGSSDPAAPREAALVTVAGELPAVEEARLDENCDAGQKKPMRSRDRAYAAIARGPTVAYVRPGGRRLQVFERVNVNGYRTVFGVLSAIVDDACRPVWLRVQLPIKPNGAVGFVRARDVRLAPVGIQISIDLSRRRLELFRGGRRVLHAQITIGMPDTPTPTGSYYVNQKLVPADPSGPFGPGALGISAFSPVLQDWVQEGPIAIHGTNDPGAIGQAASHGCVRVRNDVLVRLFRQAPAGTPVVIRA